MGFFITKNDTIKSKIAGIIKGAQITAESIDTDGSYKVSMSVPMYGVGSLSEVAYGALKAEGKIPPTPAPVLKPEPSFTKNYTPAGSAYTGLIINAQGMDLSPTYAPVIYDVNGRAVYGVKNVDPDYAIIHGIVEYTTDTNMAQAANGGNSRAGSNPLIIKAVSVKARLASKCDVVVSVDDANRILAENERSTFLEKYAVILEK